MTGRRRAVVVAVAALVVVAAGVVLLRPAGDPAEPAGAAPAFRTTDLDGRPVSLEDYRGRPVLVNFWASWCVPCRNEFPLFKEVNGERLAVLGVVFQDTRSAAAEFMEDQGATWPGLVDPGGRIADDYDVGFRPGLPVTVAIDAAGALAGRHVGELRREDLDRLVAAVSR